MNKQENRKTPNNVLRVKSATIPEEVLFHPELTARERILYGILADASKASPDEGFVHASNPDLGAMIAAHPQIASNGLLKLRQLKFISLEYLILEKDPETGMTISRYSEGVDGAWSPVRRIKVLNVQ